MSVNIKPDENSELEAHYISSIPLFQDAEVGSNLVKLPTSATAVKEKDGSIYCQPEILCEGKKYVIQISNAFSCTPTLRCILTMRSSCSCMSDLY